MLTQLSIQNVVLIEKLVIDFKQGLCVLTGETGAGKSVLLDSLGLALGVRAESGLVRKGAKEASVTATFQIPDDHAAFGVLNAANITIEDDVLLLRRMVNASGKSRAYINDQPVSVSLLKSVGDALVEIHGQFETQGLLNPATHRAMLDIYAQIDGASLSDAWHEWKEAQDTLNDLERMSTRAHEEEEYLRISLEDLQNLDPKIGEEAELSELRERVKHRESVLLGLSSALNALNADDDPVQRAWAELDKIAHQAGEGVNAALDAFTGFCGNRGRALGYSKPSD